MKVLKFVGIIMSKTIITMQQGTETKTTIILTKIIITKITIFAIAGYY